MKVLILTGMTHNISEKMQVKEALLKNKKNMTAGLLPYLPL